MAIEFLESFEGNNAVIKPEWLGTAQPLFSTTGRTGTYRGRVDSGGARLILPASAKKTIGFAYNANTYVNTNNFSIWGDGNTTQHLTICLNTLGQWELRRGTSAGTLLATSTQSWEVSVWRHIQIQATIADSGGTCIMKVDGVDWINFTGDTKNAGTNTTIDAIGFLGAGSSTAVDDLWVCNGTDDTATTGRPDNDFLGDLRVECLFPNGAGASTQWTPTAGANYTNVDEIPPNTTDYVATSTSGNRDLWAVQDVGANTSTVYAIRVGLYAAKSDAGASSVKVLIRENSGTVTADSAIALSTTFTGVSGTLRKVKPAGGAWTTTDINNLQIGVELA